MSVVDMVVHRHPILGEVVGKLYYEGVQYDCDDHPDLMFLGDYDHIEAVVVGDRVVAWDDHKGLQELLGR